MLSIFSAVLLLVALPNAQGHGFLAKPCSRQCQSYNPVEKNYDVTGEGRGGGPSVVSNYGKLKWPAGRHKLCGDAYNTNKWTSPRKVTGYYTQGSVIELGVLIWNQHGGRFGFRVCGRWETNEKKCKTLRRADGKGIWFYPPRDASDPTMTRMWQVYGPNLNIPSSGAGYVTRRVRPRKDGMNQFMNAPVVLTKWRLPAGLKGLAVIQWYWLTGNSCTPPCSRESPNFPNCRSKCVRPNCFCNDPGAAYPEEFWNCADVLIRPRPKPKAKRPKKKTGRKLTSDHTGNFALSFEDMLNIRMHRHAKTMATAHAQ